MALHGDTDASGKLVAEFIAKAEVAILARVDFVDAETDLVAHQGILRKLARRGVRKPRTKLFTTNYDLAGRLHLPTRQCQRISCSCCSPLFWFRHGVRRMTSAVREIAMANRRPGRACIVG